MTYPKQKFYWQMVSLLLLVEFFSWLAYAGPRSEMLMTALITMALAWLAWRRPAWLAYASVAELIVGSKGSLFFFQIGATEITIRMVLFGLVMLVALPAIAREWKQMRRGILTTPLILFVTWLAGSVIVAVVRGNAWLSIYADANAFIFLALLPAWWVIIRRDTEWRQKIFGILLAGVTIIGLKSWLMVLLFGQDLNSIRQVYLWIRNTGVGEITYINANVYRIFFQSQVYSLIALGGLFMMYVRHHPPRWFLFPLAMSALGVYISLSRSFWLGLAVALFVTWSWFIIRRWWAALGKTLLLIPLGIFAWAMMVWALSFPYFNLSGGRANTVVTRLNASGSADAATARANQIKPLLQSIGRHPVIGSGFGTTVTYLSTDPRTRGLKTTAAFELGYLDLWLKIGLVGLVLYAAWLLKVWKRLRRTVWSDIFMFSGLALIIVHLTTPYLNHPLGLGWLMLASLYAYDPG